MTSLPSHPDHLLDAQLDGRLGDSERRELERHLSACAECRKLRDSLVESRRALRQALPETLPPPGLEKRIRLALDQEDARRSARARRPAAPPRRRYLLPLAAMVALALLGTLALIWAPGRPRHGDPVAAAFRQFEQLAGPALPAGLATASPSEIQARWQSARLGFPVRVLDLSAMGIAVVGGDASDLGGFPAARSLYRGEDGTLVCWMFRADDTAIPATGDVRQHRGISFRVYRRQGITVVVWLEGEVLCALAGAGDPQRVVELAFAKAEAPSLAV